MNVLELFSGIGGMHLALRESGISDYKVVASIDINNVANSIYKHNFPDVNLLNQNIQGLTVAFIKKLNVDTILMSPPCQPFTRNGLQNDVRDPRTLSFLHVLELLPHIDVKRILVENVKGFETSHMRDIFVETLQKLGFNYQEFILSPTQLGVPNSRHRYYCLARKKPDNFSFETGPLMLNFPFKSLEDDCFEISTILEENVSDSYLIPEKILRKRAKIVDICYNDSKRSCCFTKSYGRYVEGTGSVFTNKTEKEVKTVFDDLEKLDKNSEVYLNLVSSLNLRFFTPREICRLMCFPETFSFPSIVSDRQKYMVLGNSINIKVVSELIKLLK